MTTERKADGPGLPALARALNAGQRVAAKLGRNLVALRKDDLKAKASKAAGGLTDFGDPRFEAGLDRLLESVEGEQRLNGLGRLMVSGQVTGLLTQRLRFTQHLKDHPEITDERIERPIFIIGAPRTGTTITHHLLSQDDRFRFPYTWECSHLHPPLDPATKDTDPRIAQTQLGIDRMLKLVPGLDVAHPVGALEAEECLQLHAYDFRSIAFVAAYNCQGYDRWLADQDMTWVYERQKLVLQYMQSGGLRPSEGWLLKSPPHAENIDRILEVFPDARFITTFREPTDVIASGASLIGHTSAITQRDQDRRGLGKYVLWRLGRMLDRNVELRRQLADRADRFLDFPMQRMVKDPMTCVAEVYERFGIELPDATHQRMQAFMAKRDLATRKPHVYDPADYGLDLRAIWDRFDGYRAFYGIEGVVP